MRGDGTGHCVILHTITTVLLPLCFQHDDDGIDVTQDIASEADSICLLRIQCPPKTDLHKQWIDRSVRRMIERRESQKNWTLPYRVYMTEHKTVRDRLWPSFDAFLIALNSLHDGLGVKKPTDQGIVKTNNDIVRALELGSESKSRARL